MEDYAFVRLNKDNIRDLHRLFSLKSKNSGTLEKYNKKYDTKYTGAEYIGYFAYDNNREPVAFYGIIPCFAMAGDNKILIAQAVDAITHPGHRRKGLFEKIVSLTTELARAEGVHFIYGVPNDLSYQGFIKKFNWSQSHSLVKFQFRTHQLPISYLFRKYYILNKIYTSYVKFVLSYLKKGNAFENSSGGNEYIYLLRDDNYFQYKNYSKKNLINLCDVSIWLSIDGSLKVGDMEKSEKANVGQVINKIKFLAFILGISKAVFQFSPNAFWVSKFSCEFKAEKALPIIYYNLSHVYDPRMLTLSYGDIDTF